jgi:5'(3')-deoxyribonucleotidase
VIAYIDMDEVLVDFVGGALKLFGWTKERFIQAHPQGLWDMTPTLEVTHRVFWDTIDKQGKGFWLRLEETPWIDHLLQWVEQNIGEWYIVTTPSFHYSSYSGKRLWLQKKFGRSFDRCILTKYKFLLAKPGTLLIDDRESSIQKFVYTPTLRETGGDGIVFPSLTNSLWANKDCPIDYLNSLLAEKEKTGASKFYQCQRRI